MIDEGTTAPDFTLPGVDDGTFERYTLSDVAGTDVVVLAFYPADFSPTCTDELCSLRDIDLFNLQQDVTIFGVSTDTAFSHRRFQEEHALDFPLLSDNDGSVAEAYGVRHDEALAGHRGVAKRAVFVLDGDRDVVYAWATDDPGEMPDLDPVREAIDDISDDDTAIERYRVAHDHHTHGIELFADAHDCFEAEDWLSAADDFGAAVSFFEEAVDAFDAAGRFAGDDTVTDAAHDGRDVANHYRQAAKWYATAADHYVRGEDVLATEFEEDAAGPHFEAEEHDPVPAPADLAPDADAD
jgi:peroxiredoxin